MVTTAARSGTAAGRNAKVGTVGNVTQPATDLPDAPAGAQPATGFRVQLTNFSGPFDLLLQLIGKQKLEITELSLSKVTDEFISYIRAMGERWDLDEVSEFLVVAATLIDLKTSKLLPQADVEDEDDLARLEARDLLFARLLQYRAFKEAAAVIAAREAEYARAYPRSVPLEPRYAEALPDLVLGIGPARLAELAARALKPKVPPVVSIDHIHLVRVSVREHALILRDKLLRARVATFRALCADCQSTLEIVARFLALLELYREGLVAFDQQAALGELTVRWTGDESAPVDLTVEEYEGQPELAETETTVDEPAELGPEPEQAAEPVGDGGEEARA
jgi:segregation and condensation protein A